MSIWYAKWPAYNAIEIHTITGTVPYVRSRSGRTPRHITIYGWSLIPFHGKKQQRPPGNGNGQHRHMVTSRIETVFAGLRPSITQPQQHGIKQAYSASFRTRQGRRQVER